MTNVVPLGWNLNTRRNLRTCRTSRSRWRPPRDDRGTRWRHKWHSRCWRHIDIFATAINTRLRRCWNCFKKHFMYLLQCIMTNFHKEVQNVCSNTILCFCFAPQGKIQYSCKVHYVPLCTSFLHAGGFSYCPMQNFYIAKHLTGLWVNTGCNTKMIETCGK